jgi:hypothetical protein
MTWDEHMAAAALDIREQWEVKLTRLFPILNITVLKIFASSVMLPS